MVPIEPATDLVSADPIACGASVRRDVAGQPVPSSRSAKPSASSSPTAAGRSSRIPPPESHRPPTSGSIDAEWN